MTSRRVRETSQWPIVQRGKNWRVKHLLKGFAEHVISVGVCSLGKRFNVKIANTSGAQRALAIRKPPITLALKLFTNFVGQKRTNIPKATLEIEKVRFHWACVR